MVHFVQPFVSCIDGFGSCYNLVQRELIDVSLAPK